LFVEPIRQAYTPGADPAGRPEPPTVLHPPTVLPRNGRGHHREQPPRVGAPPTLHSETRGGRAEPPVEERPVHASPPPAQPQVQDQTAKRDDRRSRSRRGKNRNVVVASD
jgi:hypothetical protein